MQRWVACTIVMAILLRTYMYVLEQFFNHFVARRMARRFIMAFASVPRIPSNETIKDKMFQWCWKHVSRYLHFFDQQCGLFICSVQNVGHRICIYEPHVQDAVCPLLPHVPYHKVYLMLGLFSLFSVIWWVGVACLVGTSQFVWRNLGVQRSRCAFVWEQGPFQTGLRSTHVSCYYKT